MIRVIYNEIHSHNPLWLPVGRLPFAHPYLLLFSCAVTHRAGLLKRARELATRTHTRTHVGTHADQRSEDASYSCSFPAMILRDDASPKRDCLCTLSSETTRAILALPSRDKIFRAAVPLRVIRPRNALGEKNIVTMTALYS